MEYLNYIRSKPCCVCFAPAYSDAHHLKAIGMGRNRNKLSQQDHIEHGVVPLCRKHHQEFHNLGLTRFEKKHDQNLWADAYYYLTTWMSLNI